MSRDIDDSLGALHAAAVRDVFDPTVLQVRGFDAARVIQALIPHVETSTEPDGVARWTLRSAVRTRVLARTDPSAIVRSLRADGPIIATERQRVFERWIENAREPDQGFASILHQVGDAGRLTTIEAVRSVAGWLRAATWAQPSPREVLKSVTRFELAQRLRIATGPRFVGREAELAQLGAVLDGQSPFRIATIEALGGMGKSALIAQALIERNAYSADAKALVAFIDFDDATINPLEPATMFTSLLDQLSVQIDGLDSLRGLLDPILAGGRRLTQDIHSSAFKGSEDSRLHSFAHTFREELQRRRGDKQVLVILDTLERALHTSGRLVAGTIATLWEQLLGGISGVALVLAGRTIPLDLVPGNALAIRLRALEEDAARRVLVSLDVPLERAARAARVVTGVPLTLRLAARVLRMEGDQPLDDPQLRLAVERERINGYLYRRVLLHLPDTRLGQLADPGLILRDLNADAIVQMLGHSVDPPILTHEEANEVIDELARVEDLLLTLAGPTRTLRLRPEVRQDLIALLREADQDRFAAFNAHAAAYYRSLGTQMGKSAAAYHLLQSSQLEQALELLEDPAVLSSLQEVVDELPASAAALIRDGSEHHGKAPVSEVDRALRESEQAERAGRPALALDRLLRAGVPDDKVGWNERIVRLARLTGDVERVREVLASGEISPLTAVVASELVGVPIDDVLANRAIALAAVHVRLRPDAVRALLAIMRADGTGAHLARGLLEKVGSREYLASLTASAPDLARRYIAEVGDASALAYALELELLDRTRDLALDELEELLAQDEGALRRLEEGRREEKLSLALLLSLQTYPQLDAAIRRLLLQAMEYPLPGTGAHPVAVEERAGALDELTEWVVRNVEPSTWADLARRFIGTEASRAASFTDPMRAVQYVLHAVDRRGLTERFGRALVQQFPEAGKLEGALELLSDANRVKA